MKHGQIDRQLLPSLTNIWSALGAFEAQFLSWVLLCSSSYLHKTCLPESVILSSPDDPTHLPTIWGGPRQKWHRGHILLQSAQPLVQAHSKDALAAVMSIAGVESLHRTAGLENTMTPPRRPPNVTRPTVRIGLPEEDKVGTWISHNHLLDLNKELSTEVEKILQTVPT